MLKKILFWVLWLPIGFYAILLGVSNRMRVDFILDPTAQGFLPTLNLPLFLLCFAFMMLGLLLGSYITWKRQGAWRAKARNFERENKAITQDMQRVKLERAALLAPRDPPLM